MESGGVSRTATPQANGTKAAATATITSKPVKICVYCGSSPGKNPAHMEAARELGTLMAKNNISLGKQPPIPSFLISNQEEHAHLVPSFQDIK